jgi:hypothetical protein
MDNSDRPSLRDLTEDLLKGVAELENTLKQRRKALSQGFPAEAGGEEIVPRIPRRA